MTIEQALALVGQRRLVTVGAFQVNMRIMEVKHGPTRGFRFLVTPHSGLGEAWVPEERLYS